MKTQRVAVCLVLLLAVAFAARTPRSLQTFRSANTPHVRPGLSARLHVDLQLCPLCVQFTQQAIEMLLNLILNSVVAGSCGALCEALAEKTNNKVLGEVCNILCDIVGIEEFIKLINKADLDPIYFCELLKTCAINDHGDAKITGLSISPVVGPQGERSINFNIESKNGTGTGELILFVETVDGIPVEDGLLMPAQNASAFPAPQAFTLKAEPDPDCDPTQQMCEQWIPGNYTLKIEICNGECGSSHPHSQLYDRQQTNFTITSD